LEEKCLEYDYIAAVEIRKEMEELIKSIFENNTAIDFKKAMCFDIQKSHTKITDNLIEITYSEYDDNFSPIRIIPPTCEVSSNKEISFIPEKIYEGGYSTKPGNIIINWKKLCILSCESIFPIVAATHTPWLIPFAALVICNKFWSLQNIPITEKDAIVIWTMWQKSNSKKCIDAEVILDSVNEMLLRYNHLNMNQKELDTVIKNLEKIKCIEKAEGNKWRLLEEVKIKVL